MATVYTPLPIGSAQNDPDISAGRMQRVNGTNFARLVVAFDAATKWTVFWSTPVIDYAGGTITARIRWSAATATSGVVRWGIQVAAVTPETDSGSLASKAFATAQTVNDTHLGTTAQRMMETTIAITNLDTAANGDQLYVSFYRDAANAADTMTGNAYLEQLTLEWSNV